MPKDNNIKVFDKLVSKTKVYLVIIAILLIAICFYEHRFIMPAILIFILIVMYAYWTNNKRKVELSDHIKDVSMAVDNAAKNTLVNSPFPLIVIETDGNVIWKSSKFIREFANIDISKETTEYMLSLYFIDETQNIELEATYKNSQICVGVIMIDNYEEIMQRVSAEDRAIITATIEKSLYDWATEYKGLIVKSERDTFIVILEQQYLVKLEAEKFTILDKIKEISIPGKLKSTLSIAISNEGETNYQKYKSAQGCIDIALGRGGDQAILRKDGKYTFFGGRTQEIEKRTKVKARIVSHALEELMHESKNVIIMGHANSDIDAMGSAFGVYCIAKTIGKDAYIVNETTSAGLSNFIQTAKANEEYENVIIGKDEGIEKITSETLLVIVDTHKSSYVEVPELLEKTNKIVIIDHHRRSTDFIENAILTFHEVYASSACELVTELIEYSEKDIKLNTIETEALYAGIMMDTKNFTFKTGVRTFEAAAFLRKCGIDIIKIKKWFQSDLETYNKIAEIINKTEIIKGTIGISTYNEKDKQANIVCAKAADELLTISDITASFVIGNLGDKVCISGRSIGDINVQVILEKLRRRRTYNLSRSTSRRNEY